MAAPRSSERFDAVVAAASSLSWTRDAFDRLIAGNASAAACELLTKDRFILEHFPLAVPVTAGPDRPPRAALP